MMGLGPWETDGKKDNDAYYGFKGYTEDTVKNGICQAKLPQYIYNSSLGKFTALTSMEYGFAICTDLESVPTIPTTVNNMFGTFLHCTKLITVSTIPNGVTNMQFAFEGCTSLKKAPSIPNSVVELTGSFRDCVSLENAPTIPEKVENLGYIFDRCSSLTGEVVIESKIVNNAENCFNRTSNEIIVKVQANSTTYTTFNNATLPSNVKLTTF